MRYLLRIFLMLLCIPTNMKSQTFNDQGEGKIIIGAFMTADTLTEPKVPIDLTTLLVKGYKVFREVKPETGKETIKDSLNNVTADQGSSGVKARHSMSARYIQFPYILDLKTQMSYFLQHSGGEVYYFEKPLREASFENYYRIRLRDEKVQRDLHYEAGTKTIAGKICYKASVKLDKTNSRSIIWYTKDDMSLTSPLNNWLFKFPYQILSFTGPMTKKGRIEGYLTLRVKKIIDEEIADEKFVLPPDAILLEEEAWHQKYLELN